MAPLLQFGLVNAAVVAALAVIVALIEWRVRRPALTHALWILVLVKLITPPIVKVGIDLPIPFGGSLIWRPEFAWLPWLTCGAWAAGTAGWGIRQGWLLRRFHRRLSQAVAAPPSLQQQAERLACELGVARCPLVVVVPDVISPMLCGVGQRIRLVFPAGLLDRLDDEARGTLLAHELAHYARKDHWVRALELVVTGLYWWHPVVWWARRRIEAAEEQSCDARVITRFGATPRVYAEALLETIDFLAEASFVYPPAATGLGHAHLLRQRLTQIMRGAAPQGLSSRGRLALVLLAAMLLPLHPVFSHGASRAEKSPRAPSGDSILLAAPTVAISRSDA